MSGLMPYETVNEELANTLDRTRVAVLDLIKTPVYEGRQKANGISVEFLMRLTLLQHEVGMLLPNNPMVLEAQRYFKSKREEIKSNTLEAMLEKIRHDLKPSWE